MEKCMVHKVSIIYHLTFTGTVCQPQAQLAATLKKILFKTWTYLDHVVSKGNTVDWVEGAVTIKQFLKGYPSHNKQKTQRWVQCRSSLFLSSCTDVSCSTWWCHSQFFVFCKPLVIYFVDILENFYLGFVIATIFQICQISFIFIEYWKGGQRVLNEESKALHSSMHRKLKQIKFAPSNRSCDLECLRGEAWLNISSCGGCGFSKRKCLNGSTKQIYHLDLHNHNP